MPRQENLLFTLVITLGILAFSLGACQTLNISILVPTEALTSRPPKAATLPAEWTSTPVPKYLRPLESLTPQALEEFSEGPDWDNPEFDLDLPGAIFNLGDFVNYVEVVDNRLIVGDNSGMLTVMDLTDPTNPQPLINIELGFEQRIFDLEPGDPFSPPDTMPAAEIQGVAFEDGWLYVITLNRVLFFDLTDYKNPQLEYQQELPPRLNAINLQDIYLRVLSSDLSTNEIRFTEIGAFKSPPEINFEAVFPATVVGQVAMHGNLAYITRRTLENADQMQLFAIGDTSLPYKVGEVYGAPAFNAWIDENFAYISTARVESPGLGDYRTAAASIWIVDITNPKDPSSFSYIWTPDVATGFYRTETLAYVIGGGLASAFGDWGDSYWMAVADMTDPEYPLVSKTLDLPGQAMGLSGARGIVYVAAGFGGLQILKPEEGEALRRLEGEDFRADIKIDAALYHAPYPAQAHHFPGEMMPTATYSSTTMTYNVDEYGGFTIYWNQGLWEEALANTYISEDFEAESMLFENLPYPYLTKHGLNLSGEDESQILSMEDIPLDGNSLHLPECGPGLKIVFPMGKEIQGFGLRYHAENDFVISIHDYPVRMPRARRGFFGIIPHDDYFAYFRLSCPFPDPTTVSLDDLMFLPVRPTYPSAVATGTAQAQSYRTPTPTPGIFDD